MIKSIYAYLDGKTELSLSENLTYKKPTGESQGENYMYFLSTSKVRLKTGYRQRIAFYFVCNSMDNIETLSKNLETLIVGDGNAIDSKLWKVIQINEVDFSDEMIRVVEYYFYSTF